MSASPQDPASPASPASPGDELGGRQQSQRPGQLLEPRCGWTVDRFQKLYDGLADRAADRAADGKDVKLLPRRAAQEAAINSAKLSAMDKKEGIGELAERIGVIKDPKHVYTAAHKKAVQLHQKAAVIIGDQAARVAAVRPEFGPGGGDEMIHTEPQPHTINPRALKAHSNLDEIAEELGDTQFSTDGKVELDDDDAWGPAHIHRVLRGQRASPELIAARTARRASAMEASPRESIGGMSEFSESDYCSPFSPTASSASPNEPGRASRSGRTMSASGRL
eukprot:Hpha_TRINITY_DN7176_c0_g2::TRINITY_DN7176_c0_g2_i1::g.29924::m.29924